MRLIDADRLKETIHTDFSEHFTLYHDTDQTALMDMVMDDIDEMPTAFYKEKVIEEMKKTGKRFFVSVRCSEDCQNCEHGVLMKALIEIAEKGGIE